jgi:site-specific DNA recombinase
MQGNWVNEAAYYRCRFAPEHALANKVEHLVKDYLREDVIVPRLDHWLGRLFAPAQVE